jgi:hypothetical protein
MDVEIFIAKIFEASILDQFLIVKREIDLALFFFTKQIDAEYFAIVPEHFLKVLLE